MSPSRLPSHPASACAAWLRRLALWLLAAAALALTAAPVWAAAAPGLHTAPSAATPADIAGTPAHPGHSAQHTAHPAAQHAGSTPAAATVGDPATPPCGDRSRDESSPCRCDMPQGPCGTQHGACGPACGTSCGGSGSSALPGPMPRSVPPPALRQVRTPVTPRHGRLAGPPDRPPPKRG